MVEGPAAQRTRVGLLASVDSLVFGEGRAVAEPFSTLVTFVRSLSCVCLLVFNEGRAVTEGLATLLTSVGLPFCVSLLLRI